MLQTEQAAAAVAFNAASEKAEKGLQAAPSPRGQVQKRRLSMIRAHMVIVYGTLSSVSK